MTTRLLLTGAGFSRNWGGWLGAEVTEYLLGDPRLSKRVRGLLWDHREAGGFEHVLGMLEAERNPSDFWALNLAIEDMFEVMNKALRAVTFEHAPNGPTVANLLASFDAIYTVNQDLLLETHYSTPFQGWHRPGIKPIDPKWTQGTNNHWQVGDPEGLEIDPKRGQPYIKLHGSSDFKMDMSSGGSGPLVPLVVQGAGKAHAIDGVPLLAWYRKLLETLTCMQQTSA